MNCKDAVAALIASLETATPMSDAAREHLSGCDRCARLLDSAREFQTSLDGDAGAGPAVEAATSRAEDEVVRARRRRLALRIGAAIAIVAVILTFAAIAQNATGRGVPALLEMSIFLLAAMLGAVPIVVVVLLTRAIVRPRTGTPLHKRLGPGRMLDGVALGLAEATKINVSLIRLAFLALFFFDGIGFLIYLLLDVFMPVHPDDRQYLLRFRLRRWLRRTPAAPDAG